MLSCCQYSCNAELVFSHVRRWAQLWVRYRRGRNLQTSVYTNTVLDIMLTACHQYPCRIFFISYPLPAVVVIVRDELHPGLVYLQWLLICCVVYIIRHHLSRASLLLLWRPLVLNSIYIVYFHSQLDFWCLLIYNYRLVGIIINYSIFFYTSLFFHWLNIVGLWVRNLWNYVSAVYGLKMLECFHRQTSQFKQDILLHKCKVIKYHLVQSWLRLLRLGFAKLSTFEDNNNDNCWNGSFF